jgi:predicted phosphodiesterase
MKRLLTLVHVSDLHVGDIDLEDGDAPLDSKPPSWWRFHGLFDGFLGHSHRALVDLAERFAQLSEEENAILVVAGDLTAVGSATQFLLARTYLESAIALEEGNPIGLGYPDAFRAATSGNHDHWPGTRKIVGLPTAGLRVMFPDSIRVERFPLRTIGDEPLDLVVAAIDSDADVPPNGASRVLARGEFWSQLDELEPQLGRPDPSEIRALVLHHSRMYSQGPALVINTTSRKRLDRFIEECGVAVLLTGHVHVARAGLTSIGPQQLLEARCGTTTVRDAPPKSWNLSEKEARKRFHPNTLLVHRLLEDETSGAVRWRTTLEWRKSTGFVEDRELGDSQVWSPPA